MKIEVNTLSGQTRTLEAEKSDTVASVVEKIDAADWKDPEKRVLSFNGKELENDKTLEDQGITEDSKLTEGAAAEAKASNGAADDAAEAKASNGAAEAKKSDSDGAADDGAPTDDENRTVSQPVSQQEPKAAAEQSQTSAESNGGYTKQMDCRWRQSLQLNVVCQQTLQQEKSEDSLSHTGMMQKMIERGALDLDPN